MGRKKGGRASERKGKRESSGGGWRRKEEYDRGQRLVRTRQRPMTFLEGLGHAYCMVDQIRTHRNKEVKGGGSLCSLQEIQPN